MEVRELVVRGGEREKSLLLPSSTPIGQLASGLHVLGGYPSPTRRTGALRGSMATFGADVAPVGASVAAVEAVGADVAAYRRLTEIKTTKKREWELGYCCDGYSHTHRYRSHQGHELGLAKEGESKMDDEQKMKEKEKEARGDAKAGTGSETLEDMELETEGRVVGIRGGEKTSLEEFVAAGNLFEDAEHGQDAEAEIEKREERTDKDVELETEGRGVSVGDGKKLAKSDAAENLLGGVLRTG